MIKRLPDMLPFPDGAESSPFFGALETVLVSALGFTEEAPHFCGQKGSDCVQCGNCTTTAMQKHRAQLYHDYQSFTGVSAGWAWPEETSEYQTLPVWYPGWRWLDEYFGFIFGFAGLSWRRLSGGTARDDIFTAVKASVDAGLPVLMKLGDGPDWHVAAGYDECGTLYGLDAHKHFDHTMRPTREVVAAQGYTDDGRFILTDWHAHFRDAVIIAGRAEKTVTYADILAA